MTKMIFTRRTIFFVKLQIIFWATIWIFSAFSVSYKNSNCNNAIEILPAKLGRSKSNTKDQFYNLLSMNNNLLQSSNLTEDCCNEGSIIRNAIFLYWYWTVLIVNTFSHYTEFANRYRLQQNHPCVIEIIRQKYLYYPPLEEISLHLNHPSDVDPSAGQAAAILPYLKNKVRKRGH